MLGFLTRSWKKELTVPESNLLSPFFISEPDSRVFGEETASWTVKQLTEIQAQAGSSLESFLFMNKHAA